MLLNAASLVAVNTGFVANFNRGLGTAPTDHEVLTEMVTSTTSDEEYGWLGDVPGMREWIGDRVVNNLKQHGYKLRNKDFEQTISVPANAISDDRYNTYGKRFELMGRAAAAHPCQSVYQQLALGFTEPCYDGQFFFDTDHPVLGEDGVAGPVSNVQAGAGPAWYLIASGAPIRPIILQTRKDTEFTYLDNPTDEMVFRRNEFLYGAHARRTTGFALWQVIFASKAPLTSSNYAAARAALMTMKGDFGRPLGLNPDLLLVSGTNESAGRKVVVSERGPGGEDNEWAGSARLMTSAWLG